MTKDEMVSLIRTDVTAWNRWRNVSKVIRPDLTSASFFMGNFRGANLDDALLSYADFSADDLKGASFTRAILHGASFQSANLSEAGFREADLVRVDFGSGC